MPRSSHSISDILNPALAAIVLSVILTGCSPADSADNDEGMSASSDTTMNDMHEMMGHSSMQGMTHSEQMATSSTEMMDESAYKDGTYAADGVYRSPAGAEEIHVTVTLKDDIVTAAQVTGTASHPKSVKMQEAFIAGFGAQVVGKSIDELSLDVINGSSLTPKGFMDAVAKIKVEAAS